MELYTDDVAALAADGKTSEMSKAIDFVKGQKNIYYCYPPNSSAFTDMATPKGAEGLRFYILGPPESIDWIKKEEIKEEVYERSITNRREDNFITALTGAGQNSAHLSPFSDTYFLTDTETGSFKNKYLADATNKWRSIENDWLFNAGSLAIRLEKYINNTSLAFAIEFEESGKVLLFPADAQSGNWKSWHEKEVKWQIKDKKTNTITEVTAKDLLNKTVFYKVGHHSSHNGTASKSGLDMMKSPDLVAMMPLDYGHISKGWKSTMPGKGLYEELGKRTKGRLFRIDAGLDEEKGKEYRKMLNPEELSKFNKSHDITDYYIEFVVDGA